MNGQPSAPVPAASREQLIAKREYRLNERLSGFFSLIRPIFFVLTPINAASAAVLALGGFPSPAQCVSGFFAVAFASCAVNVFNDYVDRGRDRSIWPDRPIPSGRVRPGEALGVAIASVVISLSTAWFLFNPQTFFILLLSIILGVLYSLYLRDRLGYLSLPPIVGLIYLGGWAAFSPGTLFTNFLPWYLYLLGVVWQTAHIMTYYPLHLTPGAGSKQEAPPAFFFTPSPAAAVKIGFNFTCLTLVLGIWLFFIARLHPLYLALAVAAGVCAVLSGVRLLRDVLDRGRGLRAFTSLSVFRLVISAAILLSVFLAQVGWL